jgi:hypothetical protein
VVEVTQASIVRRAAWLLVCVVGCTSTASDPPSPASVPNDDAVGTASPPSNPTTTTKKAETPGRAVLVPFGLPMLAPRAGARWAIGSLHWIERGGGDAAGAVVELSLDDGATWIAATPEPATMYMPNTPSRFLWRVPPTTSTRARFRARDAAGRAPEAVEIVIIPSQAATYLWNDVSDAAGWVWRDGAALESFGGRLRLIGGWNPFDFVDTFSTTNQVWSTADGASWIADEQAPWEERHSFGSAVIGDKLFVMGGDALHAHYQPDVWWTTDGSGWTRATDSAPWGSRVLHHAVALGGALYVMGGQTLPGWVDTDTVPVTFYNDVWKSNDGATWTRLSEHAPWPARGAICGHAVLDGQMWLLGGGTYDTSDASTRTLYNDVWSSKDGVEWTRHEDAPWFPREYHSVATFDGRLWVMAGYTFVDNENHNDVWYSSDGENWYDLPGTPWYERHAASATATAQGLLITSGASETTDVSLLTRQ